MFICVLGIYIGTLPTELGDLQLTSISVQNNLFTGQVPTELCAYSVLDTYSLVDTVSNTFSCYPQCLTTATGAGTVGSVRTCEIVANMDICNFIVDTNIANVYTTGVEWTCSSLIPTTDPCDWTGLTCVDGLIVEIDLGDDITGSSGMYK